MFFRQAKSNIPCPNLIGGKARSCAGAIADEVHTATVDEVHTATVAVEAKLGTAPSANTALTFAFDSTGIDYTNCQPPRFIDDDGNPVATLTTTTDAEGKTALKVLSSDLISQPKLIAKWTKYFGRDCRAALFMARNYCKKYLFAVFPISQVDKSRCRRIAHYSLYETHSFERA